MRVLIFGASIVQGYHDSEGGWADRLKRGLLKSNKECAVFNLGIAGDQVEDVLRRFNLEVGSRTKRWDKFDDTTIIISVGTNDTYVEVGKRKPDVPKHIFIENYAQLIDQAKSKAKNVLVCSILPVDEARTNPVSWDNLSYFNHIIDEYNESLIQLCSQQSVDYVDINSVTKALNWSDYLDDGVHPTNAGHQWIYEKINLELFKIIKEKVK